MEFEHSVVISIKHNSFIIAELEMAEVQTQHSLLPPQYKTPMTDSYEECAPEIHIERIPFSENIKNYSNLNGQSETIDYKFVKYSNKENSPKTMSVRAKLKSGLDSNDNHMVFSNENSNNVTETSHVERPCTPTSDDQPPTPVTPTANLTMLLNAMSPELRSRENKQKKTLFESNQDDTFPELKPLDLERDLGDSNDVDDADGDQSEWKPGSRKDKSLGLLCQK